MVKVSHYEPSKHGGEVQV